MSLSVFAEILPLLPLLLGAGLIAGLVAGLFGVGGGIVFVPTTYFVLQSIGIDQSLAMTMAVSTSLVSIIPTAISSSYTHHKLGHIQWGLVKKWTLTLACGVFTGALFVTLVEGRILVLFFSVFLLLMAIKTWFKKENDLLMVWSLPILKYIIVFAIGIISSVAGVGGGALSVPALRWFGLPMHKAVGVSALLGVIISVCGALSIFILTPATVTSAGSVGFIFLPALLLMSPCAMITAPLGAILAHHCSPHLLSRLFALSLFLMGLKILSTAF